MPLPTRVLVVEDEPAIADALIYALQTEGFHVERLTENPPPSSPPSGRSCG
jgi:DNA-binding response OmpR family regulator